MTPPSPAPRRRSCFGCLGRLVGGIGIILCCSLGVGWLVQQWGLREDAARFPPPGQRIDVGGYALHLWCLGNVQPNQPTMLFEAGVGRTALDWSRVMEQLAPTQRVCAYDRAGYGWSDPGPLPRSREQISSELHTLLTKANMTEPLILVGHSYGGAIIRHYTERYPETVAGMVLIDAMHEQEWANTSAAEQQDLAQQEGKLTTIAWLNRFGILRLFGKWLSKDALPLPLDALSPTQQAAYGALLLRSEGYETWLQEIQAMPGTLSAHLPQNIPLIVITAHPALASDTPSATVVAEQVHFDLQTQLVQLSTQSQQIVIEAGHDIPLEHPDRVVAAIQTILEHKQ